MGLDYEMVSFKGMNDSYIEGVEFDNSNDHSQLYKKIQENIHKSDLKNQ